MNSCALHVKLCTTDLARALFARLRGSAASIKFVELLHSSSYFSLSLALADTEEARQGAIDDRSTSLFSVRL